MEDAKRERIEKIERKYKPIVSKYARFKRIISSIQIAPGEEFELVTCKIYLLTNDIKVTVKTLNFNGYRKASEYFKGRERKITTEDVMKLLRNIDNKEKDKYKKLAREQYRDHGGLKSR